MRPDNPLWHLAGQLALFFHDEGFASHDKTMGAWTGDTLWRDEGTLPSGDRFWVWIACEL